MDLANCNIAVIGAASVIGLALTNNLSNRGNLVVAVGRSAEKLEATAVGMRNFFCRWSTRKCRKAGAGAKSRLSVRLKNSRIHHKET